MSDRSQRKSSRIETILQRLRVNGSLNIIELCEQCRASVATIRRDLQELETRGLLLRTHGGAVSLEPLFYEAFRKDESFTDLIGRQAAEKRRIGQAAAEMIEPGNAISLTHGTTTAEVIRCLRYGSGIKVVTNAVNIAMELSKRKDIEVFVTGGHLWGDRFSLVGSAAIDALRQVNVDIAFLGADGIDPSAGLTCRSPEEAAVNRVIVKQARKRIVVIDHTKFGVVASWSVCRVEDCAMIITDKATTKKLIDPYVKRGVEVRRV
jgi:DeoR family transcriptional regulator of aga operon